jgi:protocatechuate 3,4-dioxygenase beta subunit
VLLSRPPQAAGIVRDREGKPVRDARISLEVPEIPGGLVALVAGGAQRAVYSDEEGRFSVRIPQKQEKMSYQVVATHPGFAKGRSRPLEASPPAGGWPPVEIVLTPGAALAGMVTDAAGRPVARALVRARTAGAALDPEVANIAAQLPAAPAGEAAYSGEDGGYRLSALGPGSYSVEVTALGYARKTIPAVAIGEEDARLNVVLQSGGMLSGRVVDTDGQPLQDVEVVAFLVLEVVSEAEEALASAARALKHSGGLGVAAAKTDRDGRYELIHLPEGEFELVARARGYTPSSRGPLRAGEEAPDLVLSARSRLSGGVLDAATRAPVSPFVVQLIPLDGELDDPEAGRPSSIQEPEGRFVYQELPAGRYEVLVEAGDSAPALESVQLAPGREERVEVLMRPGFSIEGFVRCRSTGLPIAEASVRVDPAVEEWKRRGFFRNALSGEDGRFILRGLPEGEFWTTARHPQYYREEDGDPQGLSIPGAEALPLEIGMRPAGRIKVRVQPPLDVSHGTASQGTLEVSLRWLREPGAAASPAGAPRAEEPPPGATFRAKAWLGPDGEYSVDSLRPGVYAVEFERIGPARVDEIEVGAGRTETLQIEGARQ